MSKAKRRYQTSMRAAYVMGITMEEYARRLSAGELPYTLTAKRVVDILSRSVDRE